MSNRPRGGILFAKAPPVYSERDQNETRRAIAAAVDMAEVVSGLAATGGGTIGTLAKWSTTSALGDSIVTESGTTVTVAGTLAVTTDFSVNGNTTIGNLATADTLTVTARIASVLTPSTNNARDLGEATLAWRTGYFGTRVGIGIGTTLSTDVNLDVASGFGVRPSSSVAYPTLLNGDFAGRFYAIHAAGDWGFVIGRAVNDTLPANLTFYKTRSATGAKTVVQNGDYIARLTFQGVSNTGGTVTIGGAILAQVNGAVSDGVMPTDLLFAAVASGDATAANSKVMLQSAGHWTPYTGNTNSFDLGNTGLRWRTVYAGTSVVAPTGTFTDVGGTLSTVSQPNVTTMAGLVSVGTITTGVWNGTDIALANIAAASGASVLLGRGSAAGAGDFQEVTLGTGLTMTGTVLSASGGSGDVVGPGSATDNAVALFDSTTGKLLKNSTLIFASGAMSGVTTFTATDLIQTTRAGEQLRLRYDASNYLSTEVASTGVVTFNAVGTAPGFGFSDLIGLNTSPSLTAAVQVGRTAGTTGVSQRGISMEWGPTDGSTSTAIGFFVALNSSGLSGTWTTGAQYSLYLSNSVKAAGQTITEQYGLFVANQTSGGTNYAIYTGTGTVRFGDVVNTTESYQVDGTKVVGNQGAAITNPTGGAVIDAEARTAIDDILARLEAHGLIAT